jgi:hypothetical protein
LSSGVAIADMTPMITTTIISSVSVNPPSRRARAGAEERRQSKSGRMGIHDQHRPIGLGD